MFMARKGEDEVSVHERNIRQSLSYAGQTPPGIDFGKVMPGTRILPFRTRIRTLNY